MMLTLQWPRLILSLAILSVNARIIDSVNKLHSQYDFVIIGGGTAGCALANRLSSDPKVKVLVVEAGGSNEGIENTIIPFLAVALPGTSVDWNFTTTPQEGLKGRTVPYPRGQVLGGTSSINLLTWNRGSDDVWDRWAQITNDDGWSSDKIQPFYLKSNRLVASADNHSIAGEFVPSAHGNGPVEVSLPGFPSELDSKVLTTSKELGGKFSFTDDLNAGKTVGFSYLQSSIGQAKRSSSATAYLTPVLDRANLDVILSTRATKILPTKKTPTGKLTITTVELASSSTGPRTTVTASKELILASGVINTPQLLLLSGIGPKDDLEKLGIPTLIDNPSVGQNLTDQPLTPNYFLVNSNLTFDALLRNPALLGADLAQYMEFGTGLLVDSPGNTQGFIRLPKDSSIFEQFQDPSAGPLSAHIEVIFVDGFAALGPLQQPAEGNFMTILTAVVSPVSRGSISLASTDPFDAPLIDPAFLSSEFDIFTMVEAMKDIQTFISAKPWNGFVISPFGTLATANTDAEKVAFARNFSTTFSHPAGSASMSPFNANWGVVNPDLTLKGASGIRIVDASIFPAIPEAHIQAAVYTVAERAAALIQEGHNGLF